MIKVSVCMIAYNHEAFIAQALDSILVQDTDFDTEIVIGDDNSKDGTGKICEDYAAKYPGRIRYIRRDPNIGMMPNFISTLQACSGEYIAVCEGDDFWTDPQKLRLQAGFLDQQKEYSLCCHNHEVLVGEKRLKAGKDFQEPFREVPAPSYMVNPFFHTSSYFFRKSAMPVPFPDWYRNVLAGDHFLVLFLSMKGKIGCINRRMSVFRNHGSSVSFTRTALDIKENFVQHLRLFDAYSGGVYQPVLNKVIRKWDLLYKVYEPVGYFPKLGFLLARLGFSLKHFRWLGGFKLYIKYLVPAALLRKFK